MEQKWPLEASKRRTSRKDYVEALDTVFSSRIKSVDIHQDWLNRFDRKVGELERRRKTARYRIGAEVLEFICVAEPIWRRIFKHQESEENQDNESKGKLKEMAESIGRFTQKLLLESIELSASVESSSEQKIRRMKYPYAYANRNLIQGRLVRKFYANGELDGNLIPTSFIQFGGAIEEFMKICIHDPGDMRMNKLIPLIALAEELMIDTEFDLAFVLMKYGVWGSVDDGPQDVFDDMQNFSALWELIQICPDYAVEALAGVRDEDGRLHRLWDRSYKQRYDQGKFLL